MSDKPNFGFTANERFEFLEEEAKKLKVGDRIEIERCITPMSSAKPWPGCGCALSVSLQDKSWIGISRLNSM